MWHNIIHSSRTWFHVDQIYKKERVKGILKRSCYKRMRGLKGRAAALFICVWASSVGFGLHFGAESSSMASFPNPGFCPLLTDSSNQIWWSWFAKSCDSSDFPVQIRGMREELHSFSLLLNSSRQPFHAVKILKLHVDSQPLISILQQAPWSFSLSQVSKDLPNASRMNNHWPVMEPELRIVIARSPPFLWPLNYLPTSLSWWIPLLRFYPRTRPASFLVTEVCA